MPCLIQIGFSSEVWPRQPNREARARAARARPARSEMRGWGFKGSILQDFDVAAADVRQQFLDFVYVELRVLGFDADEEPVIGELAEVLALEKGMIQAGQAVQGEHPQEAA